MKGIKFSSKSGNLYFYDDLAGHIFNINDDENMEAIQKIHTELNLKNSNLEKTNLV